MSANFCSSNSYSSIEPLPAVYVCDKTANERKQREAHYAHPPAQHAPLRYSLCRAVPLFLLPTGTFLQLQLNGVEGGPTNGRIPYTPLHTHTAPPDSPTNPPSCLAFRAGGRCRGESDFDPEGPHEARTVRDGEHEGRAAQPHVAAEEGELLVFLCVTVLCEWMRSCFVFTRR